MSKIDIVQYPDPRLARKGEIVTEVNDDVRQMIDDMWETHKHSENCAALACTQLAFDTPRAITVIHYTPNEDNPLTLVNPEIIERKGSMKVMEGCMSVPAVWDKVERAEYVKVRALDRDGKPFEIEAEGELAKCFQHEIDHLHGLLFIDHLSKLRRSRAEKKIAKYWRWMKANNGD